jgi:hypothetical protein
MMIDLRLAAGATGALHRLASGPVPAAGAATCEGSPESRVAAEVGATTRRNAAIARRSREVRRRIMTFPFWRALHIGRILHERLAATLPLPQEGAEARGNGAAEGRNETAPQVTDAVTLFQYHARDSRVFRMEAAPVAGEVRR